MEGGVTGRDAEAEEAELDADKDDGIEKRKSKSWEIACKTESESCNEEFKSKSCKRAQSRKRYDEMASSLG